MRALLIVISIWLTSASMLVADGRQDALRLMRALRLEEVVEIMRQEGLRFGQTLGQDMLPSGSAARWQAEVARLYDPALMMQVVQDGFIATMAPTDSGELIRFFEGDLGQRLVAGELRARAAFLDKSTENAAIEKLKGDDPEQAALLKVVDAYIAVNELVENNVVGALNSNYRFYQGLAQGGMIQMSEAEIVQEVWSTADATRVETGDWLRAYLLMAYADLSVEEITTYVTLCETSQGQAFNRALFASFEQMYSDLSYGLGLALSAVNQGQEL